MEADRTFTKAQQRAAYDALGLDPLLYDDTQFVGIDARTVLVTRLERDAEGRVRFDPETGGPAHVNTLLRWREPTEGSP